MFTFIQRERTDGYIAVLRDIWPLLRSTAWQYGIKKHTMAIICTKRVECHRHSSFHFTFYIIFSVVIFIAKSIPHPHAQILHEFMVIFAHSLRTLDSTLPHYHCPFILLYIDDLNVKCFSKP